MTKRGEVLICVSVCHACCVSADGPGALETSKSSSVIGSGAEVKYSVGGNIVKVNEAAVMNKYKEKEKNQKFYTLYFDGSGPFIVNDKVIAVGTLLLGKTADPQHECLWSFKAEDFKNALEPTAEAFYKDKPESFVKKQVEGLFAIQRRIQQHDPSNEACTKAARAFMLEVIKSHWDCFYKEGVHRPILGFEFDVDTTGDR